MSMGGKTDSRTNLEDTTNGGTPRSGSSKGDVAETGRTDTEFLVRCYNMMEKLNDRMQALERKMEQVVDKSHPQAQAPTLEHTPGTVDNTDPALVSARGTTKAAAATTAANDPPQCPSAVRSACVAFGSLVPTNGGSVGTVSRGSLNTNATLSPAPVNAEPRGLLLRPQPRSGATPVASSTLPPPMPIVQPHPALSPTEAVGVRTLLEPPPAWKNEERGDVPPAPVGVSLK